MIEVGHAGRSNSEQFEDKRAEREMAVLQRKAEALGFQLVSQGGVSA